MFQTFKENKFYINGKRMHKMNAIKLCVTQLLFENLSVYCLFETKGHNKPKQVLLF